MASKLVFMGTAELAAVILEKLAADPGCIIKAVVTQPDKPKGRDLKLQASPVKLTAQRQGLLLLQPVQSKSEPFIQQIRDLEPDLIVVAAYGQILSPALLQVPRHGCVNVHTSILPGYRGAAPIQRAIADGLTETGVTLIRMDSGLDTGPILATCRTPILPEDNAVTLHDRLALLGANLLLETLPGYIEGKITPVPQSAEGVSYASKIRKEDGKVNWRDDARIIWNRMRGFSPWPGIYTFRPTSVGGQMIKIWRAEVGDGKGEPGELLAVDRSGIDVACGVGSLRILELQREGGKRLPAGSFLSGLNLERGEKWG